MPVVPPLRIKSKIPAGDLLTSQTFSSQPNHRNYPSPVLGRAVAWPLAMLEELLPSLNQLLAAPEARAMNWPPRILSVRRGVGSQIRFVEAEIGAPAAHGKQRALISHDES
jgi:hypothetical protein